MSIRCLALLAGLFLAAPWLCLAQDGKSADGFTPLFNGKDLTGWKVGAGGKQEVWGAENGILFVNGGGGGWLFTEQEYANFELSLEFKLPEMGNSGVALRSPVKGDPAYVGMEIQILDDSNYKKNYKGLRPTQLTGAIYDIKAPSQDATKPHGEWNTFHIVARGNKITVTLNGVQTVDADLNEFTSRLNADGEKKLRAHPGLERTKGHIGLQSHDGRVEFRNIRIKVLD